MKKKLFLFFVAFILSHIGFSQCSTMGNIPVALFGEINGSGTYDVKVYWNVVNDGDMPNLSDVELAIDETTLIYSNHGINLTTNCHENIEIINDPLLTTNQIDGTSRELCNVNEYCRADGLNIFFMNDDVEFIDIADGVANIGGNKAVVKIAPDREDWRTLVHEIGHCFGLFHPFHARPYTTTGEWDCTTGEGSGSKAVVLSDGRVGTSPTTLLCDGTSSSVFVEWEKVDGSNSNVAGDFITDTPAHMSVTTLGGESGSNRCDGFFDDCDDSDICEDILEDDQRKDQNCDQYQPDWNTYMGYRRGCQDHFTDGQISRMKGLLGTVLNYMVITEAKPLISDLNCTTPQIDLNTLHENDLPSNVNLIWSTDGDSSDGIDPIINSTVTADGTYFAYYYFTIEDCFGPVSEPVDIVLGDPLYSCSPCVAAQNIIIDNNETVNGNQMSGNLIINSGTVIINHQIEFGKNSKVIVKPGAKLIIEGNGLLTKCPDASYWQGIVIEGLNNTGLGSGIGGKVEIRNGGAVEYAKIGVNKINEITSQSGNGQSVTSGNVGKLTLSSAAAIRNCEVGVRLNSTGASLSFGGGQESSEIDDAFFTDNETAIELNHNHGLTLNRNTFEFNYYGIEATNSSADIYDNNFADIGASVLINALYPSLSGLRIERNVFTDGFAIYTETLNNAEYLFINQNVSIGAPIWTHGLVDYQVTSNDVIDCFRGMQYSATGSDNANLVASNSFSNNEYGVNVDGTNNMEYLQNCFENTAHADIGLGYGTSIREEQGEEEDEAANCFDGGARLQTVDDNPELSFDYYKYPQSGNPSWDCKEPNNPGSGQNYNVLDAQEEINESCGSGVAIYGEYPNFLIQYRDCHDFISRNLNDVEALEDLITSLEEEIDRLEKEVKDGALNYWIARTLIAKYEECVDRAKKNIVMAILHNPSSDTREDAIKFLADDGDFTFNIMAYSLMMDAQEYTRALSYLNTLNPDREDEHDFVEVQGIYHQYLSDPIGFSLSSSNQSLIHLAGNKRFELAGFARKIYHLITGDRIFLDVPTYDDPRGQTREVKKDYAQVNIYPNPSIHNSDITIELNVDAQSCINHTLKVYNTQGILISERKLVHHIHAISLPDQKGLLFITVEKDGKSIHSEKILRL